MGNTIAAPKVVYECPPWPQDHLPSVEEIVELVGEGFLDPFVLKNGSGLKRSGTSSLNRVGLRNRDGASGDVLSTSPCFPGEGLPRRKTSKGGTGGGREEREQAKQPEPGGRG